MCEAARCVADGLVDADLGGGVIVLFRKGELAFFIYGFAKSGRDNLRPDELATFRMLADEYLKRWTERDSRLRKGLARSLR